MEEVLARIFQFSIALIGAFTVALWFALVIWTYRDAVSRSRSALMQIFSTLIVVLFFVPGVVIYLLLRPRETLEEKQQRWVEEEYLAQELDDVPVCPSCNHHVRDEWIFCPACRYQLRRPCHSCGRLVESGWEICAFCGVDLRGSGGTSTVFSDDDTMVSPVIMSQPRSLPEDSEERHTTADGMAVMLQSEEMSPNGAPESAASNDDETGEFPLTEEPRALEGGKRRR